ncbi:MAG: DUF2612 domain-containing protein [Methyloprofundus sp.]|nr:DUF2612 domain-containing protein [Methyloprofundus sp.]
MSKLIEYYKNLLIKQYWQKPKASKEIGIIAGGYSDAYTILKNIAEGFDVDTAVGNQLDIVGSVVGLSREVPEALLKIQFGFSNNPNSVGFASKFDSTRQSATFSSKFAKQYTTLQLNDFDYRFFIQAKIASNNAAAVMLSDDRVSIQSIINTVFSGRAYVVDNYDMTLTLYVNSTLSTSRIKLAKQLNLLPKPQAVRYSKIIRAELKKTFGFSSNPDSLGFSSKFSTKYADSYFATKVII